MKKIILALMLVTGSLYAEGYFVGADVGYGNADADVSLKTEAGDLSTDDSTDTKILTLKGGYATEDFRFFGYVAREDFKDNIITDNDDHSDTIGVEFDVMLDDFYVGALVGFGQKDIASGDENFVQYGAKVGYLVELDNDLELEIGFAYKIQEYDSKSDSGDGTLPVYDNGVLVSPGTPPSTWSVLDVKEETATIFIGLNFSL